MAGQSSSAAIIQGVASPDVVVDPPTFYGATRRMTFSAAGRKAIAGLGSSDSVQLRQTGIVASVKIRVTGTLVFGGTITGTSMSYEWPLNLMAGLKLSANGQSNLISCKGLSLRAYEFMANPRLGDSGIQKTFGTATPNQGTLALASDDWGTDSSNALAPGASVAATGTYTVDLSWRVPVAADPVSLIGAVYAQSSGTNLTLEPQWAEQSKIITLGGAATVAVNLKWSATIEAYSIPQVNGQYVVPDLSQFHQLSESRSTGIGGGADQYLLPGTGTGRRLLRTWFNVYSSSAPLAMSDDNFTDLAWAYGGNDSPEVYPNGGDLRAENLRQTGTDLGGVWGIGLWDFASQFALRDSIDEATVSDLRLEWSLVDSPTSGAIQVAQETIFAAPAGA